jgi:hypothetical protein
LQVSHRVADFQAECCESVFEGLMNRCFLRALKDNIDLNQDIANECVAYSTNVLRNAGGISLLMNTIESADPKTKSFLSRIANECVAVGCEMSKDMILSDAVRCALEAGEDEEPMDMDDEVDPEDTTLEDELGNLDNYSASPEMPAEFKNKDISDIQLDTKITEKELNALKQAAAKTDIDAVSNVISDKVSNVLQSEKFQRHMLNEEKERLKTAIMDNPGNDVNDENAAEAVMTRMLAVPTADLDTTVYNSLFSTLQRRAIESILAYENVNIPVSDILTELTINNTFDIFKPMQKTFESVTERATFMSAAMECGDDTQMDEVMKKATTIATIVYTMLEMLNTTKLNSCTPMDVKHMVTKNAKNVAPTNDVANVVNRDYKRAIEDNKRRIYKCTETSDVEAIKAKLINTKVNLMSAKESGIAINDDVIVQLSNIIDIADRRIDELSKPAEESVMIDRMTTARAADVGNLNLIASSIKYKNFDNIKFKCVESTDTTATFDVFADKGKENVYKTHLYVKGLEGVEVDKYMKYLVSKSKFNDMTKNDEPIDFAVIHNGHLTSI